MGLPQPLCGHSRRLRADSADRQTSFALSWSEYPASTDSTYQLKATVPHQIVGGTYKPTYANFRLATGFRTIQNPDPDGEFIRQIADDPPMPPRHADHQGP